MSDILVWFGFVLRSDSVLTMDIGAQLRLELSSSYNPVSHVIKIIDSHNTIIRTAMINANINVSFIGKLTTELRRIEYTKKYPYLTKLLPEIADKIDARFQRTVRFLSEFPETLDFTDGCGIERNKDRIFIYPLDHWVKSVDQNIFAVTDINNSILAGPVHKLSELYDQIYEYAVKRYPDIMYTGSEDCRDGTCEKLVAILDGLDNLIAFAKVYCQ